MGLNVADIGPRHISLSWTEPEPIHRNGIIRHYLIYVSIDSPSSTTTLITTPFSSTFIYTLTVLHPHTTYHITVAAVTISPGPNSTELLILTEEDGMNS